MYDSGLVRPSDLAAVGGEFSDTRLDEFFAWWNTRRFGMPWAIWQWTDDIRIEEATAPTDLDYLERARVFGAIGDLDVRRDCQRILWRFVGDPNVAIPDAFGAESYWRGRESKVLRPRERVAWLWGEHTAPGSDAAGVWKDDRVAWASLRYPGRFRGRRRVQCRFREYLRGANVELVWFLGLEPAGGGADA